MALLSKCNIFYTILATQIIVLAMLLTKCDPISWCCSKICHGAYSEASYSTLAPEVEQVLHKGAVKHLEDSVTEKELLQRNKDISTTASITREHGYIQNSSIGSNNEEYLDYNKRIYTGQVASFQAIDNSQAWVYSAYFDHVTAENGKPTVRVFGLVRKEFLLKIYCNFKFHNTTFTSAGHLIDLPEPQNRSVHPAFTDCSLPINVRPTHVSISFQTKGPPTNRLQIIYPGPRVRNFTVCYSVLHSNYNMASQLIESIELNRILGAEHFLVYNYSVSLQVDQILSRYQQEGLVTVLAWSLPTQESWYYAQMTALNDCFYRNRNISRFVVVVDTDEIIVPRNHYTWIDLINNVSFQFSNISDFKNRPVLPTNKQNSYKCFIFKSSNFYSNKTSVPPTWDFQFSNLSFTKQEKYNIARYHMLGLSQFWRSKKLYQFSVRSKYIACPESIDIASVHYVNKLTIQGECLSVDNKTAIVHHYRKPKYNLSTVLDTSILKFKQLLYTRIILQYQRFPTIFGEVRVY